MYHPFRSSAAILSLALVMALPARSFEFDGLQSGMSYAAAKSQVAKQSFSRIDLKEDRIEALDPPSLGANRDLILSFCKGRLVQAQRNLQPRFDYFVRLVDEKRKQLGQPLDVWSRSSDPTAATESHDISIIWRDGSDFVTITYTQFTSNNQLAIINDARNDCWRVPY